MIVNRYISKEVLINFLAITCILLFVALSNQFISLLAKVAVGQLPANLVFNVILLYVPELLASLMPLGLFIAILFAYGRLHADSEMAVLFTCGFNWADLTKLILVLSTLVAMVVLTFTCWVIPNIAAYREKILAQGEALGIMQAIVPGQFQIIDEGRLMFYVEDLDKKPSQQLVNIFIAEQPQPNEPNNQVSFITAARGYLQHKDTMEKLEQKADDFFLILKDGHRYTGTPGTLNYTVINFGEYGREIKTEEDQTKINIEELLPTRLLLFSSKQEEIAELQWRLSLPISVIILGLLAIPLSKVSPRQGRFAKFLPAILLYIAYFNLMLVSKRWVGAGTLPARYGMWWVHCIFGLCGCILLAKVSGRLSQMLQKYRNGK